MKNGILTLLFLSLLSCMPEEELPMKDMGEISGYFIECYCKPGEFYTLNAAKVSPIHEIIDLSDPINLDVSIKADSIIKLIPTFSPSFLGNFRHDTKFNQFGLDSLYLSIYTPEKEHITAKTAIPDPIAISSYSVSKVTNSVTISFQTSLNPMQNYYIYSVQARKEGAGDDNLLKKETSYLDLSRHTGVSRSNAPSNAKKSKRQKPSSFFFYVLPKIVTTIKFLSTRLTAPTKVASPLPSRLSETYRVR